ncbi:30S ribosome-binding factor RbfA [Candidatus Methylocalor cossyra]|uniref:Ribosome-binding factor A n=1 Tax=Candidatus Methylocalor cossyra TaxID=3108543 RepID=A0ABM9NHD8_9GAMM
MPREFSRSDRVASQIQREMAELIRTRVKEPRLGMITVNAVEVSRDLAVAKIYVSFLGAEGSAKDCVAGLAAHGPELRRELGRRLHIRVLPELRFLYDDSIERGMRMDALLDQIARQSAPEDPGKTGEDA